MKIFIIISVAIGAVAVLKIIYNLKKPNVMEEKKPAFALLPKYTTTLLLNNSILRSENIPLSLETQLKKLGFTKKNSEIDKITFVRGSAIGDFSINLAKVIIEFDISNKDEISYSIRYGALAAFDTGDLWGFSKELIQKLS